MQNYMFDALVLTGWAIGIIAVVVLLVIVFDKITDRWPFMVWVTAGWVAILFIYVFCLFLVMS